jgi:putative ABC transport system ATP-binding protein
MGKSGSGKSTLLNILGGLMSMDSGEYYFKEKPQDFSKMKNLVSFRRDCVGFVVQYFALIDDLTVYENIALPLRYQKCSRRQRKERVNRILDRLGLSEKKKAYPDELSGGQQQRVAIARALVKNPEVILADEPTGALDRKTGQDVMQLLKELQEEGKTIVIVTHDAKIAEQCDRVIYMEDGKICG